MLALLSLMAAAVTLLPPRPLADADWVARQTQLADTRLDLAAGHARARLEALSTFVDHTAAATDDSLVLVDPFAFCRRVAERWPAMANVGGADSLAVVLRRGDERLAWWGPVVVGPAPPGAAAASSLRRDDQWWVIGGSAPLAGATGLSLECQIRLAPTELGAQAAIAGAGAVRASVVGDARAPGRRASGDAQRGLRVSEDIVLGPADAQGQSPRLRLEAQAPPQALQQERRQLLRSLARLVLSGLGLACLAGAFGGGGAFWAGAWIARALWARADLGRMVAAAMPAGWLPAAPDRPESLLDPAYFATTFGGGWFASSADALLSGLLVAGTAHWAWRRLRRAAAGVPAWRPRLLLVVPAALVAMLALRRLWLELVANANARLIGLEVPLESWSFWALHATILLLSCGAGLVLLGLVVRLAGGVPDRWQGAARPFWQALGLLTVMLLNHAVLSHAYEQAERDWLQRKAEQIVTPQDDWIIFLLEDVLGEMATAEPDLDDHAAVTSLRGALRREAPAYRLWRGSAMRDLGLPSLVEVIDQAGETTSLFATGFLRDFGYEILTRGPWQLVAPAAVLDAGQRGVAVQEEERLYPTGRERILRGEVARGDDRGWLRLELPVQSRRIATLLGQLVGAPDAQVGGYRPRVEVDRPVLLWRGDDEGWLDAGFGELPQGAVAGVVDELRRGERQWATLDHDGSRWLCRWAPLPPQTADSPGEGFLLGLQRRGLVELLLDIGRLVLLDVLLLGAWAALGAFPRRRWRWRPGFQGRFLLGYLAIGVVLLVVAGSLADRQTFQRIDREARERTRDGLVTSLGQLRGLLVEQARALAGSDYVTELLAGRLAGERPLGPYTARQGIVFGPEGELLLDETLSDLDERESRGLLAAARQAPLVVMHQPEGLYLGVVIPLDLGGVLEGPLTTGTFFYRQQVDAQLLPALADVVGGEITLRLDGEVVEASHPGRVLGAQNPLLAPPEVMAWFERHPGQPGLLVRAGGPGMSGGVALPSLSVMPDQGLTMRHLPAVLTVDFPDRARDAASQRRRMVLFLAGLTAVLLVAAFGLAMVLTWKIFDPLRVLLAATQRLASGDYAAPLPPAGADEVGRLATGFCTMRDRLREARAVLAARERFLQAVLDQVPVGVLVWDDRGRLAASNPAAAAIMAAFYPDLPAEDGPAAWSSRLRHDVAAQLPPLGGELVRDDGRRTLRVGLAPLELGGEAPHQLLVCEDLTEFLATKKLALNAELARQVAHEIKNPLTPIQLSAQLLLQAHRDGHPRRDQIVEDAVQRILDQVALLRSIAGEFSLLGRPGELECGPVDLPALVAGVVAGYRAGSVDDGPRVNLAPGPVPAVLAHRDSLVKVLGNLMQNSLDAVGSPGDLEVEVAWQASPATVALRWTDNGPGIAPDVAARLFNPYFSTKSKGTGLGLAICRNLLDMMGGTITLVSGAHGAGAVATVTLRRAEPAGPDPQLATGEE